MPALPRVVIDAPNAPTHPFELDLSPRSPDSASVLSSASASLTEEQSNLIRRDSDSGYIPLVYQGINSGPAAGTVVGIVLGSVAGFLLILWLLHAITNQNNRNQIHGDEEIVVRERRPRSPRSRRSRRSSHPEVREISRSPRRQHIIVEERRQSMPPPRPRSRSILVDERIREGERRVAGDDVVEVIEEHDPPRHVRRSSRRETSSYRSVDPVLYAGSEDYSPSRVQRGRSYSRHSRYS